MREFDYKESWAPKNWCFWSVVLEKTLESPLDCKEIQPFHPRGYQSWVFIGRADAEVETPILWPPDAKSWLIWKDPDATLGVGDGQGGLACCGLWGHKKSDTTKQRNLTEATFDDRYIYIYLKLPWDLQREDDLPHCRFTLLSVSSLTFQVCMINFLGELSLGVRRWHD